MKKVKLKRLLVALLIVAISVSLVPISVIAEAQADETISNTDEFLAFKAKVESGDSYTYKTVQLSKDIDLTGTTWTTITEVFNGTFDGNGKTISGLSQPLFNKIDINGTVKNLVTNGEITSFNTKSSTFEGQAYVGTVASFNYGVIKDCLNNADITLTSGNKIGGIVGLNAGVINLCGNTGKISNKSNGTEVGGIVGQMSTGLVKSNPVINNSFNKGTIEGSNAGGIVGGIGININAGTLTISDCFNFGTCSSSHKKAPQRVGAIIGKGASANSGYTITNVFSCVTELPLIATNNNTIVPEGSYSNSLTEAELKTKLSETFKSNSNMWVIGSDGFPTLSTPSIGSIPVTSITMSDSSISLYPGDTYMLKPQVLPENATNKDLIFSSSDSEIVEAYVSGGIKALKEGSVTITISSTDGSAQAFIEITVSPREYDTIIIPDDGANVESALKKLGEKIESDGRTWEDIVALKIITNNGYELTDADIHAVAGDDQVNGINQTNNPNLFYTLKFYDLSEANFVNNTIPTYFTRTSHVGHEKTMPNLIYIKLPASVETVDEFAFHNTASLKTVEFAEGSKLKSINRRGFSQCTNLSSINLKDTQLQTLGAESFIYCSSLKSLDFLPNTIEEVGFQAFRYSGIKSVDFTKQLTNVKSFGNQVFSVSAVENVVFPDDPDSAVYKSGAAEMFVNTNVKNIVIPASVKRLDANRMFFDCAELETVTFESNENLEYIGREFFGNCSKITAIAFPDSITGLGHAAIGGTGITRFSFYEQLPKIKEMPSGMFANCSNLSQIILRDDMTMKEDCISAFSRTAISEITLPEGMDILPDGVFSGCKNLTNEGLHFKAGQMKIAGCYVFGSTGLTHIPDSDIIDWDSFSKYVSKGDKEAYKYRGIFYNSQSLTDNSLPKEITALSESMFAFSSIPLKTLNGVSFIGQYAFESATGIQELKELPEALNFLGSGAFVSSNIAGGGTLTVLAKNIPNLGKIYFGAENRYPKIPGYPEEINGAFKGTEIRTLLVPNESVKAYRSSKWLDKMYMYNLNGNYYVINMNILGINDTKLIIKDDESIKNHEDYSITVKQVKKISKDYKIFDIYMLDKNGDFTQPSEGVTVTLPVPDGFGKNIVLYRTENDGSLKKLDFKADGNNITFTADHFSLYTIVSAESSGAASSDEKIATTSDSNDIFATISLLSTSILCIFAIEKKRKTL